MGTVDLCGTKKTSPITLCNKLLFQKEEEKWLCLDCRATLVNIYKNQHHWQKWSLQKSSGSRCLAKTKEEQQALQTGCSEPAQRRDQHPASELGTDQLVSLVLASSVSDVSRSLGRRGITILS